MATMLTRPDAVLSDSGRTKQKGGLRIAFIVGKFPAISQPFIIDQVADLLDRGVDVHVFAFERGSPDHVSPRYERYRMADRTCFLEPPYAKGSRLLRALPRIARLLRRRPAAIGSVFNPARRRSWTLRSLYAAAPLAGESFDLVHCHFGDNAVNFLEVRSALGKTAPLVTTFYGYDVSHLFLHAPPNYYDELKRECALVYVMSENMRQRVVAHGFPAERVKVHPVGINLADYPFAERQLAAGETIELLAVGRLVEKKGFDDLLRALAKLKASSARPFHCSVIGEGPLQDKLERECEGLGLKDMVTFRGSLAVDRLVELLPTGHVLVAPSKTAGNGDME
jgi:colanic acid/amylovoran biosynthesis glycosyltransferase